KGSYWIIDENHYDLLLPDGTMKRSRGSSSSSGGSSRRRKDPCTDAPPRASHRPAASRRDNVTRSQRAPRRKADEPASAAMKASLNRSGDANSDSPADSADTTAQPVAKRRRAAKKITRAPTMSTTDGGDSQLADSLPVGPDPATKDPQPDTQPTSQ